VLALQEPNFALVGHCPDVRSCLLGARKQPVGLDYATACSPTITQTQDSRVETQEVGTELFKRLVVQFWIEREV
jgi:hypothetical protein